MNTRSFDLLTQPLDPGQSLDSFASISWSNARNFSVKPDKAVADLFSVSAPAMQDGQMSVTVTNTSKTPARFAAIVTCDTDEDQAQEPKDFASTWPSLV